MLTATAVIAEAKGPVLGHLVLKFEDRYRRRIRLTMADGTPVLLNFAEVTQLDHGAYLDCGEGCVQIKGAIEPVLDIQAHDAVHLASLAWHLGNRHLPLQILPPLGLRIAADPVIADMLAGLKAHVTETEAVFAPGGGAYGGGPTYGHQH